MVTYYNTETQVLVGDHIEFKIWVALWRGWQPGRVHYVPGISPKNPELERDGMLWVSVHSARDGQAGIWVEPSRHQLRKTVRFVRRTDDDLTHTPINYYFGDEKARNETSRNA
jgi:hypothetical protein